MSHLNATLDRAGHALRKSIATVRRPESPGDAARPPQDLHPTHKDSPLEQSIAALHAVVWIASFVQSIFNEITGRSDDL